MVVVGFGGIHVEVLNDTAARLAPVSSAEALASPSIWPTSAGSN